MRRAIVLVTLAVLFVVLLLSGIADTKASIADTSIPDEAAASVGETDKSDSATATITITWTTASLDDE